MSNLIERLRQNPNYRHWLVMAEAADEIERLRAALRDIRDTTANQCTLEQWHKKALAALEVSDE